MSWSDKKALEQIIKFRDYYNISIFAETGTFKGVNAAVHSNNFKKVYTCEIVEEYYNIAKNRLSKYENVYQALESSNLFLSKIKLAYENHNEILFIYLDAHFYDPNLNPEDRWVIIKELKYLYEYDKCVIAIHDFDCNGLGHLNYDGQSLNFELIKKYLYDVNPNFNFYVNDKSKCDILTKERIANGEIPNLNLDEDVADNLDYAWSNESKTYRGILYCTPTKIDLNNFDLIELKEDKFD